MWQGVNLWPKQHPSVPLCPFKPYEYPRHHIYILLCECDATSPARQGCLLLGWRNPWLQLAGRAFMPGEPLGRVKMTFVENKLPCNPFFKMTEKPQLARPAPRGVSGRCIRWNPKRKIMGGGKLSPGKNWLEGSWKWCNRKNQHSGDEMNVAKPINNFRENILEFEIACTLPF